MTIVVGHFGSGKTEVALNVALQLADRGARVALVDLDVVKPYFRSRSVRAFMAQRGVRVVAPEGDLTHADLPIVVPEVRRLLMDRDTRMLIDAGGDPVGARVLGSLADVIPHDECEHLLVLNFCRPYTETVDDAVAMVGAIEQAARIPVTGIISNTHLLGETTPELVVRGWRLAEEVGRRLGIPVVAVGADEATRPGLADGSVGCPVLPLARMIVLPFERGLPRARIGPLFRLT